MKKTFFTLKNKIILMVLALIVLPLSIYSYLIINDQSQNYLKNEDNFHKTTNDLVLDSVNASYYGYINQKINSIMALKRQLFTVSSILRNADIDTDTSSQDLLALIQKVQLKSWYRVGIRGFIYNQNNPQKSLMLNKDNFRLFKFHDIRGIKLENYIKQQIPISGVVYYFYKEDSDEHFLCIMQPTIRDPKQIIVTLFDISAKREEYNHNSQDIINSVSMLFDSIQMPSTDDLLLFDSKGKILLSKNNDFRLSYAIEQKLLEDIKNSGSQVINIAPKNSKDSYRLRLSYFKPLNWYVATAKDTNAIADPLYDIIKKLLLIGIVITLISLAAAVILVIHTITPLKLISKKARELAQSDLKNPEAIISIAETLPIDKGDEIGNVSSALYKMSSSLAENIHYLIETTSKQKRLEGELDAAGNIQKGMLPEDLSCLPIKPYSVASLLIPAKEVGGDLFDVIALDNDRVALIIGDVSDKSVPAALFMTMTVTLIREGFALGMNPSRILTETNARLSAHNPNMMFVTLFVAVFNLKDTSLIYANGGHCPPLIIHKNGKIRHLDKAHDLVVGAVEDFKYSEYQDNLNEEETLLLYTDGITEAQNEKQELFSDARLEEFMKTQAHASAQEILDRLYQNIVAYRGNAVQSDDITAICFKHL